MGQKLEEVAGRSLQRDLQRLWVDRLDAQLVRVGQLARVVRFGVLEGTAATRTAASFGSKMRWNGSTKSSAVTGTPSDQVWSRILNV